MPMDLPKHPRLFQIKKVNYKWLFPRCKAAIIQGDVGMTAAALRAKILLIIILIIADQPCWGKIFVSKGLGVHILFRKITAQKLLGARLFVWVNRSIRRRAFKKRSMHWRSILYNWIVLPTALGVI
jgi:UDP:flavonoid glycosyltransferase YjiC (YdhE family)